MASHPSIPAASLYAVSLLPLGGDTEDYDFGIEGYVPDAAGLDPNAQARTVAGRYFEAMGIPLRAGRFFGETDRADREPVVLVSDALARQYWPAGQAVGKRIKIWGANASGPWRTVVGVVGDVRHRGLSEPETPTLYLPVAQWPESRLTLVARGEAGPPPVSLLQDAVRSADPGRPVYDSRDMAGWLDRSMGFDRFTMFLATAFGATALGLAALGIYGVMSLVVAGRTREFAVRMALGAPASSLARRTVRDGVLLSAAGLAIGLPAALAAERYLASVLYDVRPIEPLVLVGVSAALAVVATISCAIPARRAQRVDPVTALRAD